MTFAVRIQASPRSAILLLIARLFGIVTVDGRGANEVAGIFSSGSAIQSAYSAEYSLIVASSQLGLKGHEALTDI